LQDQAQLAKAAVPNLNAQPLVQSVNQATQEAHDNAHGKANIVHGYQAIAAPLDQLISDLEEAAAHAQRQEIVRQPDLDDTPPAYRSAVSDYFETMSKDYHPDGADAASKKP
jgi:hypothetical protein